MADRFCDECGVDKSLHPTEEPAPWSCENANWKADLMDRFWSFAGPPRAPRHDRKVLPGE